MEVRLNSDTAQIEVRPRDVEPRLDLIGISLKVTLEWPMLSRKPKPYTQRSPRRSRRSITQHLSPFFVLPPQLLTNMAHIASMWLPELIENYQDPDPTYK